MNHLDLVGWINTARYKWAEIMGREIKFKPATFYLGIADHLARVVEGQEPAEEGGESGTSVRKTREERQDRERAEMADSLVKGESAVEGAGAVGDTEGLPGASATTTQDAPVAQPQPQTPLPSTRLDVGAVGLTEAHRRKDEGPPMISPSDPH